MGLTGKVQNLKMSGTDETRILGCLNRKGENKR